MIKNDSSTWFPESNPKNFRKEPLAIVPNKEFVTISVDRVIGAPYQRVEIALDVVAIQQGFDLDDIAQMRKAIIVLVRSAMLN